MAQQYAGRIDAAGVVLDGSTIIWPGITKVIPADFDMQAITPAHVRSLRSYIYKPLHDPVTQMLGSHKTWK